jgi:hypothetical protein
VTSISATATTSGGTQTTLPVPTGTIGTGNQANQLTVNLTGVPNASHVAVTLHGVTDSAGNSGDVGIPADFLLGDVNSSRHVDAGDVGLVQRQNSQPLTTSNFRMDVNVSGHIDAGDVGIVQRQNSTGLQ